jgi:hypothetical protein
MDRAPSARVEVDASAIGSTTAVLPIVAAHNPGLSRLFHLAASAANQQQSLPDRLSSGPDPEPHPRQGNAAAASVEFLREVARGRRNPPLAAARAGSLFPLFYLVEITHPQLLQSQSCTRSRVRVYNTIMVIAWRPCHIHQTSRRISTLYRITGDSGKSRASPNFTIDLDQWRPTAKVRKCQRQKLD